MGNKRLGLGILRETKYVDVLKLKQILKQKNNYFM